jgi:hypothetical protein
MSKVDSVATSAEPSPGASRRACQNTRDAGNGLVLDDQNCGTANGIVARQGNWLNNSCREWTVAS